MAAFHFISYISLMLHILLHHASKCEMFTMVSDASIAPALILFGDSILDPGNNNNLQTTTKANFPPYGRDFEGGIATGRFSNGKIPGDFIVQTMGIKSLMPAYLDPLLRPEDLLTGVSFASGGVGYDPLTALLEIGIPLDKQLAFFKEYILKLKEQVGDREADFIVQNARYLIMAGNNDIALNYFSAPIRKKQFDIPSYTDFLINRASKFISELYALGPRKLLILGVPPLGCLPALRSREGDKSTSCLEKANMASVLYNTKLEASLPSLKIKLPLATLTYIDVYKPLQDIILHPGKFGFKVSNKGCCGTGSLEAGIFCNHLVPVTCSNTSASVFWDAYHPTERAYKILADHITTIYHDSLF